MDNLKIDLASALSRLEALLGDIEEATEKALDRASIVALQSEQREAGKTYARPIPTYSQVAQAKKQIDAGKKVRIPGGKKAIGTGGGTPAWTRSGDLKSQLEVTTPAPLTREIGPVGSSEAYFDRLANLPTGALGVNRSNPIKDNAQKVTELQIPAIIQTEIANALAKR